jgi:GDP/UDP-N,N'-diacetylbacillosamine 2-epimerase (hydrolysing)
MLNESRLKLCVVTGSRAEYGLLWPLMKEIVKDRSLQLQLLVTGMHLAPEFGSTYREIEKDGFIIDEKIDMLLSGDNDLSSIKSCGLGMIGFADAYSRLNPDWVILLGDRFEIFAAAYAAHQMKLPISHLHGGELTEGATDDAMRHAITKMSYLHFTSTDVYRNRVIQLGEDPTRVFNVGAIGLDNIKRLKLLNKKQLEKALGMEIRDPTFLVTFHPVTLEKHSGAGQIKNLLSALDEFPNINLLFTLPNADSNARGITQLIREYVEINADRAKVFNNLGQLNYLSVLQFVKMMVGNSSSGIIEAPQFKIPTVNVGDRQSGRIKPRSVIDTGTNSKSIENGIKKALSQSFLSAIKKNISPYDGVNTTKKIIRVIKKTGKVLSLKKSFYDLKS